MKIDEVIVVEGRDDTARVKEAVDCETIETHGFGISKETWSELERAYGAKGLIILTDPDHAGENIRRKLKEKFPEAKEAFLPRREATISGDIGIENASPEAIREALGKVRGEDHGDAKPTEDAVTMKDMDDAGLTGKAGSRKRRELLSEALGISYGNAGAMLGKINAFGITIGEFRDAVRAIGDKETEK